MKKKLVSLLIILVLLSLSGCKKASVNHTEIYNKINTLMGDYTSDYLSYQVELTAKEKNIVLRNEGTIINENGVYTYTYSTQTLNQIGSGADSLITTTAGELKGSEEELMSGGLGIMEGTVLSVLNLKDSFKSHDITQEGGSYVMTGYIARNTIIKHTENLDNDIRFYYKLTVDADITQPEELVITYTTTNFDSVVITIRFKEA